MNKEELIKSICRQSLLIADNIGLGLSAKELKEVYEQIGRMYMWDQISKKAGLDYTLKDYLKLYGIEVK